jgi:FtsP/CotA-like multicopper oxidase with cupredoxin domain
MSQVDELKIQPFDTEAASATREENIRLTRRRFLYQALTVTSGIALLEILPSSLLKAVAQANCPTPPPTLVPVSEISSQGTGKLQAVINVMNGNRSVPGQSKQLMLRYYAGFTPNNLTKPVWPTTQAAGPGPTLRCEVGDSVQITLLNQVNVAAFQGSLYSGEKGTATGCDEVTLASPNNPADTNFYPANDKFPNCFHASSAANIHFHGTHVSPSTTGDNVLVNILPDPNQTVEEVKRIQGWFEKGVFDKGDGEAVKDWNGLPSEWKNYQIGPWPDAWKKGRKDSNQDFSKGLVGVYDNTAPYTGPGANSNGHGLPGPPKYPKELRLWPKDKSAIDGGRWPQYYVGSYPICFRIPKYVSTCDPNNPDINNPCKRMGQAPGTHWYHSHKHGSTSVNLFNGLAGALIIEDNSPTGYDGALKAFYAKQNQKLDQVVLVFQQITDTINMLVGGSASTPPKVSPPPTLVNGQLTPTIEMHPGQIQLWRMINATVATFLTAKFVPCSGGAPLQCVQTAQDGVQFSQTNYKNQLLGNTGQNPIGDQMAPANRIDLLVQAPTTEGLHVMQTPGGKPILYVNVKDDAVNPQMQFPPSDAFPVLPLFLADVPANVRKRPPIRYGSVKLDGTSRTARQFNIDNKQFEDGHIDQVMTLDTGEEWTIVNEDLTGIAHPFHIHVNPFQISELYDPNAPAGQQLQKFDKDLIWWDAFAIPAGRKDGNGNVIPDPNNKNKAQDPGYFKMRSRFVDFTGLYVQHCHILAHEDRGMMQLLQVCRDPNSEECKKQANVEHH